MSQEQNDDQAITSIGTHLLQGWVLTNEVCSNNDCRVPLLSSKDATVSFCVLHDEKPTVSSSGTGVAKTGSTKSDVLPLLPVVQAAPRSETPPPKPVVISTVENDDDGVVISTVENDDVGVDMSADNVSSSASPIVAVNEDEARRRREQSAKASKLIGQKMLQGWALIDDVCPSTDCFGVPLIRNRAKQLYCVICERTYMKEADFDASRYTIIKCDDTTPAVTTVDEEKKQPGSPPPNNTNRESICKRSAIEAANEEARNSAEVDVNESTLSFDFSDDESSAAQSIAAANERKRAALYSLGHATLQYYTPPASAKAKMSKPLPPIPSPSSTSTIHAEPPPLPSQLSPSVTDLTLHTLMGKMDDLRRRVEITEEPEALAGLFNALKACAEAMAALRRV
ncbi:hypothetical protein BC936DRAFT_144679 [Jimgerdemannia flammicorona]|uniref:Uncharacterized protein n=1 Tax=Jimgerdemannia flammicorona TaxID=994334 RepID=A0A433DBY4_9FUNG|nr:hypothetical protein BC936DRAFT_144679 [Jimgerdemannia flammicorona]